MNYLIINIVLLLVSATILHLLLFKKFLKQAVSLDLDVKKRFRMKIGEIAPIIMVIALLSQFEVVLVGHRSLMVIFVVILLVLLFRMVRSDER